MNNLIRFMDTHKFGLKIWQFIVKQLPKKSSFRIQGIIFRLRYYLFFKGKKFACPFCRHRFKVLLPCGHGTNRRLNAICPIDFSFERHRLLWFYFFNRTNIYKDKLRVLHISPEYCFKKIFKKLSNLNYICADKNPSYDTIEMDITNIFFEDNSFDVIICIHVLEHILEDIIAMKELFRVLKPGGWVIIQCPIDFSREKTYENKNITKPEDREKIYGQSDHVRIYGRDIKERFENIGFRVKIEEYGKSLNKNTIQKYRLNENELIYFCIK